MSRTNKKNHPKPHHQNGLTLALLGAALAITLWIAGRNILGDDYLPIRWANFASPWIIVAAFALIITALLKKLYIPMAALIWPLGLALCTTPDMVFAPATSVASITHQKQPMISVISFNVGRFNQNIYKISELISNNPADIIFLQEVSDPNRLASRLSGKSVTRAYNIHRDKTTGLVLLTHFNITSVDRLPGVLTRYKIDHPIGEIALWNIHVPRSVWSTMGQKKVMANLLGDIKRHLGPKIIAGDFNLTPHNDAIRQITNNSGSDVTAATPLVPTFSYPTPTRNAGLMGPWVQIDHIIVSDHFRTGEIKRLKSYAGSDHYPISVQLKFRGKAYTGLGKGEGAGAGAGEG